MATRNSERDSKATTVPLDVLHIPRGTINSRPRETTIDLVESYARFPSIAGVGNSSDSFADFHNQCAIRRSSSCIFETFDFILRLERRVKGKTILRLDALRFLCNSAFDSFTFNLIVICDTEIISN